MGFGHIDFCETPWGICKYESPSSAGRLFAFTGRIRKKFALSTNYIVPRSKVGKQMKGFQQDRKLETG